MRYFFGIRHDCGCDAEENAGQDAPVNLNLTTILSVGRIVPNRVCCNCVMAAYARAKPPQYHKVSCFVTPSAARLCPVGRLQADIKLECTCYSQPPFHVHGRDSACFCCL